MHRYLGLLMLVPMFGWAVTGLIFFIKPGYDGAYDQLKIRTYPLEQSVTIPSGDWDEARVVRSVLGWHLLVQRGAERRHLNLATLERLPVPSAPTLSRLFSDAVAINTERYGDIVRVEGTTAYTSTGIKLDLDWATLALNQTGLDRQIIDTLYKIHYLQWTPWPAVNRILGALGLVLLVSLAVLGLRLLLGGRSPRD